MRALALVLLGLVAGCVDLGPPRAFLCQDNAGCNGGWVCLRDQYCHDPSVGVEVVCVTKADCTGGWFCGQELKCLNPATPAAFPCDDDSQCASPWRCSSERRCVDPTTEPAALPFRPAPSAATLESPLTTPADLVRTAPQQTFPNDGGPVHVFLGLTARGATLEVDELAWVEAPIGAFFQVERRTAAVLPEAPDDLAIALGFSLVKLRSGSLVLSGTPSPVELTLPVTGVVDRLVPLTWQAPNGEPRGAFAVVTQDQEAALIDLSGASAQLSSNVVDLAGTGTFADAGGPLLVLLREVDGGHVLTHWGPNQAEDLITFLPDRDAGIGFALHAARVRVEHDSIAVTWEQTGGLRQYSSSLICRGSDCSAEAAALSCPSLPPDPPDIAMPVAGTLRLACNEQDQGTDFLYDVNEAGQLDFVGAPPSLASWGTSRGHVRQSPRGQLSFSDALADDMSDVLNGRPQVLGVAREGLVAVRGMDVYSKPLVSERDAGLPLGLSLSARLLQGSGFRPAAFVEGEMLRVLENGVVVNVEEDGGVDYPFVLPADPAPEGTLARVVESGDGGRVLIVTTRDALYAGTDDPLSTTLLSATLRPAPGFPIAEWALRPADGGFLEGWAVANNRLFRVTASTAGRWKSSELPVTGRDPLGVWFSGDAVQLGTASGEVLALPSRLPVVPPLLDGVTSMTGVCGSVFATTSEAVWQVISTSPGRGEWTQVDLGPDAAGLVAPMLTRIAQRLFILDELGVVLELPVSCP